MIINNITTDSNNVKFINTGLLSGIANSIRKKGFMNPDEKIKVQDYASIITSIGNELSGDFINGGVYIPAPGLTNMHNAFYQNVLILYPVCGKNVTDMSSTYYNCLNLTGSPVCGPNVTNMSSTYYNCYKLTGSPVCGPNVTDISNVYKNCLRLTGSPVCGPMVTDMSNAYYNCYNLTGSPVCGPNVTDISNAYYLCSELTGSPVCGPNVTDISNAYYHCQNLTGSPVCGPMVTDMSLSYFSCWNLTGSPVCGPKVKNMCLAYQGCHNLTGSPVCGPNVTDISFAYQDCDNLNGIAICGPNVTTIRYAYSNCSNLNRTFLILSNKILKGYNTIVENAISFASKDYTNDTKELYGDSHFIFANNNVTIIENLIKDMIKNNGNNISFRPYSGYNIQTLMMPYKGYGEIKNATYNCEYLLRNDLYNINVSCGVEVI